MRGREAKLTFLLGFQCRILHKKTSVLLPDEKPALCEKSRFSRKFRFYRFSTTFFVGHDKTKSVNAQHLQSSHEDLILTPLILCGTSLILISQK